MNMTDILEKLHRKPRRVRRRISVVGAAVITSFIFMIWFVSLPARLENKVEHYAKVSPLNNLKSNMASALAATKEVFSGITLDFSGFNTED